VSDSLPGDRPVRGDSREDSTASTGRPAIETVVPGRPSPIRIATLLAAGLVVVSTLTIVYRVMDVVGDPTNVLVVSGVAVGLATAGARLFDARQAAIVAGAGLAIGLTWYLVELPTEQAVAFVAHAEYILALLSGRSVLVIVDIERWMLAVVPAPVFLTWFLTLRRRYLAAAAVGGSVIGFFVLTGDAALPVATVGSVGVLALSSLGTLERAGGTLADAEITTVVLAVAVVASLTLSVVPQGTAKTYSPGQGFEGRVGVTDGTLEADLLATDGNMQISGDVELSGRARWTVESDRERYWRVGAYDLYTGDGWSRQSASTEVPTNRAVATETVRQRFTAESRIATAPAAWRPTEVAGVEIRETAFGGFAPSEPLEPGQSYVVESRVVDPSARRLQQAGDEYPAAVASRFLQLPASTPDRVEQTAAEVTAGIENPYNATVRVKQWLENAKGYSLSVDRPSGPVADAFLFEMTDGYCTYFATTMAVMLRTQGIPARLAVGYTPGERIGENTWRVRGYDSHAWVEVYFPDVGWVQFDPTPAQPRERAARERLAGSGGEDTDRDGTAGADTETSTGTSGAPAWLPDPDQSETGERASVTETPTPTPGDDSGPTFGDTGPVIEEGAFDGADGPGWERPLLGSVIGIGMIAGARRSGLSGRLYRAIWLRWQPRSDPVTDVERAYDRVETLYKQVHRPRRTGETPRQYFEAVGAGDRAMALCDRYEQARYAGDIDREAADQSVTLADAIVTEHRGLTVTSPDSV